MIASTRNAQEVMNALHGMITSKSEGGVITSAELGTSIEVKITYTSHNRTNITMTRGDSGVSLVGYGIRDYTDAALRVLGYDVPRQIVW